MTVSVPRMLLGIVFASLVAGPAFLGVMLAGAALIEGGLGGSGQTGAGSGEGAGLITLILLFASAYGFILSVVPNAAGTGLLGRSRPWARLPAIWGAAGGLLGLAIGVWFDTGNQGIALALAMTGALCALTCRYFIRWRSNVTPVDEAIFR